MKKCEIGGLTPDLVVNISHGFGKAVLGTDVKQGKILVELSETDYKSMEAYGFQVYVYPDKKPEPKP